MILKHHKQEFNAYDIFGNHDNNPRLSGVSSYKKGNITSINKVFLPAVRLMIIVLHGVYAQKILRIKKKTINLR